MRIYISFFSLVFSLQVFAENNLNLYEIPPFYNFQSKSLKSVFMSNSPTLNPERIVISEYKDAKKINIQDGIKANVLKGERVYKSLIIENMGEVKNLNISLDYSANNDTFNQKNTEINVVPTWFQAGNATTFSKLFKFLTHELLLKTDINVSLKDGWGKRGSKWYYQPPEVLRGESVFTLIPNYDTRRLLVEIDVPDNIVKGVYTLYLSIQQGKNLVTKVPITITVEDVALNKALKDEYKLFMFTSMSLDPNVGRRNSYINGQNYYGSDEHQRKIYQHQMADIKNHGFNGVFMLDWRLNYANEALTLIKKSGLKDVVVFGTSFIEKDKKIVRKELVDVINSNGFEPIFYGYDEPGGNKKLKQQIKLNKVINGLGAKSINAIFWSNHADVIQNISNKEDGFSFLTISMGSHGSKEFLNALPLVKDMNDIKYLAYWHPHVENPTRNKLFMGYWLWASGLDGISPHTYSALPHISQYVANRDKLDKSVSVPSPYNDFGIWDNVKGIFRQHATVYPERNGVIRTLQWEAAADGVTDLILVKQLENLVELKTESPHRKDALSLLKEIKAKALVKDTSALDETKTDKYLNLMAVWKQKLRYLIVEMNK